MNRRLASGIIPRSAAAGAGASNADVLLGVGLTQARETPKLRYVNAMPPCVRVARLKSPIDSATRIQQVEDKKPKCKRPDLGVELL